MSRVVVRLGGLGRIDLTGAYALAEMLEQAEKAGFAAVLAGHIHRWQVMTLGLAAATLTSTLGWLSVRTVSSRSSKVPDSP